jgi:hypothetical protein
MAPIEMSLLAFILALLGVLRGSVMQKKPCRKASSLLTPRESSSWAWGLWPLSLHCAWVIGSKRQKQLRRAEE